MQQNIAKKPYNHCRYAGNVGDVWKHVILLEAMQNIIRNERESFHYFETHGGPGFARLGIKGDWNRGIGHFFESEDQSLLSHPYFQLALPPMKKNNLYKGSWVLVANFLKITARDKAIQITAHERDPSTIKMARSALFHDQLHEFSALRETCGFEGLQNLKQADFVFIDPPYRSSDSSADDWSNVFSSLINAQKISEHWMVWYPIFRRDEPDRLIEASDGVSWELTWAEDAPGWVMKGCGMLMPTATSRIIQSQQSLLEQIALTMGGTISVRS